MSKNDIEIVIGAQDDASRVIDQVSAKVGSFSDQMGRLFASGAGLASGFGAANFLFGAFESGIDMMVSGVTDAVERVDQLTDTARSLGETVGDVQAFQFALDRLGNVSGEKAVQSLQKIQATLGRIAIGDNAAGAQVLERLGLDAQRLSLENPIEQFRQLQGAISGIADPSERAAVAQELLGKSAADLLPVLSSSNGEFDALIAKAEKLGFTISEDGVEAFDRMKDSIDDASKSLDSIYMRIASDLAPSISEIADAFNRWYENVDRFNNEGLNKTQTKMSDIVALASQGTLFNIDLMMGADPKEAIKPFQQMVGERIRDAVVGKLSDIFAPDDLDQLTQKLDQGEKNLVGLRNLITFPRSIAS